MAAGGIQVVGNRSQIRAVNNGMSAFTNFGMFENFIAFINMLSYSRFGSARFNEPAMTSKDFTALIPKS